MSPRIDIDKDLKSRIYLKKNIIHINKGTITTKTELLGWFSGKESTCQCRRPGFHPWVRKICWRRKWQSTLVLLPGKSHGQRSLVGYTVHGVTKSRTRLSDFTYLFVLFWFLAMLCRLWDLSSLRGLNPVPSSDSTES